MMGLFESGTGTVKSGGFRACGRFILFRLDSSDTIRAITNMPKPAAAPWEANARKESA